MWRKWRKAATIASALANSLGMDEEVVDYLRDPDRLALDPSIRLCAVQRARLGL
jgi:hypothetical protein